MARISDAQDNLYELRGRASDISPAGSSGWLAPVIETVRDSVVETVEGIGTGIDSAVDAVDDLTPEWLDNTVKFVAAPMIIATEAVVTGAAWAAAEATGIDAIEDFHATAKDELQETSGYAAANYATGAVVGTAILTGKVDNIPAAIENVIDTVKNGAGPDESPSAPADETPPSVPADDTGFLAKLLRFAFPGIF